MPKSKPSNSDQKTNRNNPVRGAITPERNKTNLELSQSPVEVFGPQVARGNDPVQAMLQSGKEGAFGNGSVNQQAARLNDRRLAPVQRQSLAAHIGRVQGNRHLGQLMAARRVIQRGEGDEAGGGVAEVSAHTPGTKLEYNYEFKKVGNHSGSIRVAFETKGSKLVEGKAGYEGKDGEWAGGKFKLLENKATLKRSGGKTAKELATALGSAEAGVSPFSWLTVKLEGKALEAKMDWEKGETDLAAAKIAVVVQGTPPEEWLASMMPPELASQVKVSVSGKYEYKIPYSDLAHLKKMQKAGQEMAEETKALTQKSDAYDKLAEKRKNLEKELEKTNRDISKKGHDRRGKKARSKLKKQAERLKKEMGELGSEMKKLDKEITKHKGVIKKAGDAFAKASRSLKSKTGKLAGKALGKAGAKILGKLASKLVPGLNIITTAIDIVEIGTAIYDIATGEAKWGFGGGDGDSKGKKSESEGEGGGEEAAETEEAPSEGGSSGEGTSQESSGTEGGQTDTESGTGQGDGTGSGEGSAGLIKSEEAGAETEGTETAEEPPELSPNAEKIMSALGTASTSGTAISVEDLETINAVIPNDLTPEQLEEIIARLKATSGTGVAGGDINELIGRMMVVVHNVQTGQVEGQETASVDGQDITSEFYDTGPETGVDGGEGQGSGPETGTTVEAPAEGGQPEVAPENTEVVEDIPEAEPTADSENGQGLGTEAGTTAEPPAEETQPDVAEEEATTTGSDSEAAEETPVGPPERLLPEMPPVLDKDPKTKRLSRNEASIVELETDGFYRHPDGLKVEILEVAVDIQDQTERGEGEESEQVQLVSVSVKVIVGELPKGAGEDYPYHINQVAVENFRFWWKPSTETGGEINQGVYQALSKLVTLDEQGKPLLKPGVAGTEHDLDIVKAEVIRITSHTTSEIGDDKLHYEIYIEIVPTELYEGQVGLQTGEGGWQRFVIGQPLETLLGFNVTKPQSSQNGTNE